MIFIIFFHTQRAVSADIPVCPARAIRYAVFDSGYYFHNGKGMDVDIANELSARTQCKFDIVVLPIARLWAEVQNGKVDMVGTGVRTAEREKYAYFFNLRYSTPYIVAMTPLPKNFVSMEQIMSDPTITIGVQRQFDHGVFFNPFLEQLREANRVIEAADTEALLKMLVAKRFSVALIYPMSYRPIAKELKIDQTLIAYDVSPPNTGKYGGLALSMQSFSASEAEKWGSLVSKMHKDGTVRKILSNYLPEQEARKIAIP
ncbi:substrate-binding periplasmic protein [Undibacterium sp. SXout20W]|uniref:substrate-binding periplasmic protein n=1 Tax=Undibacterium sp. SXout20W TaxID=3413051 RepID=UPI003BF1A7D2